MDLAVLQSSGQWAVVVELLPHEPLVPSAAALELLPHKSVVPLAALVFRRDCHWLAAARRHCCGFWLKVVVEAVCGTAARESYAVPPFEPSQTAAAASFASAAPLASLVPLPSLTAEVPSLL